MSYTPTTWTTGDTITASALNKIENGIANAGGDSVASVRTSASGFDGGSKTFGYIVTAYRDNNTWVVSNDSDLTWVSFFGYSSPQDRVVNVMIPSDTDVAVFLLDIMEDEPETSGGISSTSETLYYSYGSVVNGNAYKITGNGSFEFIGM